MLEKKPYDSDDRAVSADILTAKEAVQQSIRLTCLCVCLCVCVFACLRVCVLAWLRVSVCCW